MRKPLHFLAFFVFVLLLSNLSAFGQIVKEGSPPSFKYSLPDAKMVVDFTPKFDWSKIAQEDSENQKMGLPLRAGLTVPVEKGINDIGEWSKLPDGRMLWRVTLKSDGATGIGVVFDQFELPEGSELYLYNQNKSMVNGALGSHNNSKARVLSTQVLYGSSITIEYIETPTYSKESYRISGSDIGVKGNVSDIENFKSKALLRIGELMYMYSDIYSVFDNSKPSTGSSAACQIDINCEAGSNWQDQKRGVAHTLNRIGSDWYFCSGTMINNTLENFAPYFLTAFHCGEGASDADRNVWQFYFNYERPSCGSGTPPTSNMITGCELRAFGPISGGSDMLLVELNSNVPLSYNPYYNGWDRNDVGAVSGAGIHHPAGDVKKISTFSSQLTSSSPNIGGSVMATNSAWRVVWSSNVSGWGVTEGGSSGSPIFNNNGLVVGSLTGGSSTCASPTSADFYGKFSYHWQSNGTTIDKQVKSFLDPAGLNPMTLRGWDPKWVGNEPPVANFTASATTVVSGTEVSFADISTNGPTQWEWNFGDNAFPRTSTQRNPKVTWMTPGTYTVSLTVTNANGSDTKISTNFITITPFVNPTIASVVIGTLNSGNTGYPISLGSRYPRTASLYTAAEIGSAGVIEKLAWYTQTARAGRPLQVFIKHIDPSITILTSALWADLVAGATEVFNGTISNTANAWTEITLTTPFAYNGTSNILVLTFVNASYTSSALSASVRYSTEANKNQIWAGTTSGPNNGTGTVNSNRPNIILNPNVAQYFNEPVASFAGMLNIFSENFEGETFPPTGWTINNQDGGGVTWTSSSANNNTSGGTKSAYHIWGASGYAETGWLISPKINLPAGKEYILSFWSKNLDASYYGNNSVRVSATGTAVTDFSIVWSPSTVSDGWEKSTIDLSSFAGQEIYIAFRYQGTYAHGWHLDDILLGELNYESATVFEGDPLTLFNKSTGSPTVFNWLTPGANITESNQYDVNLKYDVAGNYDVTLKVGNPLGVNVKTAIDFVNVVGRAPQGDFIAKGNLKTSGFNPFIPVGGTVSFTDKSLRLPKGWSWVFTGATPSSSTIQNPEATYNEKGLFDVTLTATNDHGNDVQTKSEFVKVGGNDFVTNLFAKDIITGYNITGGHLPGHGHITSESNTIRFYQFAEKFSNNHKIVLHSARLAVREALGTDKNIQVTLWDGVSGQPGAILASKTVAISNFVKGGYNLVEFDSPIIIENDFFIGFQVVYDASHSYTNHLFSVFTAANRGEENEMNSTAWFKSGTTEANAVWSPFNEIFSIETSMAIQPNVSYYVEKKMYNLTINKIGNGSVKVNGADYTEVLSIEENTEVTLAAFADENWLFSEWTGDLASLNEIESFTINADKVINITFTEKPKYSLTVTVDGYGSVSVNDIAYTETVTFYEGEVLNIVALPTVGHLFDGWSGDISSISAVETITMDGNKTITATFSVNPIPQKTLTIVVVGNGTVEVNQVAYTHAIVVDENTVLNLKAIAAAGNQFDGWSGDISSISSVETITMNGDKTITATFSEVPIPQKTLTIVVVGNGTVEVDEVAYTQAIVVDENTVLNLKAIATAGNQFDGWSGDISSINAVETITMNGNKTITATFSEIPTPQYTLTVVVVGNGTVEVDEVAYTQAIVVDENTVLNLKAIATTGNQFDGWSGAFTSNEELETVIMDGNKSITATFSEITSVNNGFLANLTVYPNPFKNSITIKNADGVVRATVTNLIGQTIMEVNLNGSNIESFSADQLVKGVYLLTLYNKSGEKQIRKIVKE
jgi:PKD repeat protein